MSGAPIPEPSDTLSAHLTVRMAQSERDALDSLVTERARALRVGGGVVTASGVMRGLLRREIETIAKRKARAPR